MASGLFYQTTTRVVDSDIEFLADENVKDTFSHTIVDDGIEANELGHKIVEKGSWIDADGKKVVPTVTEDNVTFDSDPIGLLFSSVDVTYGPADGAILYMGKVQGNWLNWGDKEWNTKYGEAIVKILPLLRFVDKEGHMIYNKNAAGGGSSSSTVNFDLSKATGTLAVKNGGTGATSASEALDALLESQPLSIENGGTGKGTANEALDALLESQPLPIENGGTGATTAEQALTKLGAQKAGE